MSNEKLSKEQIAERLLAIRQFIATGGFNNHFGAKDTVTNIDSMIVSLSDESLELEDYDFIQNIKKKETEQINKAIKNGKLREAKALLKYAIYASENEFPRLIEDVQTNKLKYKKELLKEIEELKKNPLEFEFTKITYESLEECIQKTMPILWEHLKNRNFYTKKHL